MGMKSVLIPDAIYKYLMNDARKRKLTPDELVQVILKREYKLK